MAGSFFFALLDDIVTIMDDVAVMTKVAARKTVGLVGDDIAVNADQVTGETVDPKRELPIVWAVTKGSLRNKAMLVPAGLALSAFAPFIITPLLMAGGSYLCYEGAEKVIHAITHRGDDPHEGAAGITPTKIEDPETYEKKKIKGAIRTDLILSGEIIAITLGAIAAAPFVTQAVVLSIIGVAMTVGVYGLVAGIVKLDDFGLHMASKKGKEIFTKIGRTIGRGLVNAAPKIMKTLSVVGTAAMFLVGGGILAHGIPGLEPIIHTVTQAITNGTASYAPVVSSATATALGVVTPAIIGLAVGGVAYTAMGPAKKLYGFVKRVLGREKKAEQEDISQPQEKPETEPTAETLQNSRIALQTGIQSDIDLSAGMNDAAKSEKQEKAEHPYMITPDMIIPGTDNPQP